MTGMFSQTIGKGADTIEKKFTQRVEAEHNANDVHKYYTIGSNKERELLRDLEDRINTIDYKYIDFLSKSGAVVKDKKDTLENISQANKMCYMLMMGACAYPVFNEGVSLGSVGKSYLLFKTLRAFNPELDTFYKSGKDAVVETFLHNMGLKEQQERCAKGLDPKGGRWQELENKVIAKKRSVPKYEVGGIKIGHQDGVPKFTARSAALTQIGITKHAYDQLVTPGLDRKDLKDLIANACEVDFIDDKKSYNDPVDRLVDNLEKSGLNEEQIDEFMIDIQNKCQVSYEDENGEAVIDYKPLNQKNVDEIYKDMIDKYDNLIVKDKASIIEEYNKGISAVNDLAVLDGVSQKDINKNVRFAVSTLVRNHPEMSAYFKEYNEASYQKEYVIKDVLNAKGEVSKRKVFTGNFLDKNGKSAVETFTLRMPEDMFAHGDKLRGSMRHNLNRTFKDFENGNLDYDEAYDEIDSKFGFYVSTYMYYHANQYEDSPFKDMDSVKKYKENLNSKEYEQMDKNIRTCISDIGFENFTYDYFRAISKSAKFIDENDPIMAFKLNNEYSENLQKFEDLTGLKLGDVLLNPEVQKEFGEMKAERYNYDYNYNIKRNKENVVPKYEKILEDLEPIDAEVIDEFDVDDSMYTDF